MFSITNNSLLVTEVVTFPWERHYPSYDVVIFELPSVGDSAFYGLRSIGKSLSLLSGAGGELVDCITHHEKWIKLNKITYNNAIILKE